MHTGKDRLAAFNDAVLAIVMTIIVLEFSVPNPLTLESLLGLWPQVAAYAISFFWLGAMWINQHNFWHALSYVRTRTVWVDLVMLFFSSFFPLTTHMVAANFDSSLAQVTYGVVILGVTFANVALYRRLVADNPQVEGLDPAILGSRWRMWADIGLKVVGLVLSATVFPPAMTFSVLATLLFLVIPPQLAEG
ncbi:MAG: DUF1211 domain-containing protein [Olsenella sp.]|nr:DUF1211 domain-containing protein [Olsenella sp.]